MSKIRQALDYERQLSEAKVAAHIELTNAQLKAEGDLREMANEYERQYTNGQFGQLKIVAEEHRLFHEREHLLYEDAIEKASSALNTMLSSLQADVDRFREEATKWMTIERFEREHVGLIDKVDLAIKVLSEKIVAEEKVTLRTQAQEELLTRISQNNKWLIGILITVGIFGATTVLHVFNII